MAVDHLRFGVRPGDAILRRTARAAAALVGVHFLTPFVSGLSSSFQQSVGKYFPVAVAFAVSAVLLLRRAA